MTMMMLSTIVLSSTSTLVSAEDVTTIRQATTALQEKKVVETTSTDNVLSVESLNKEITSIENELSSLREQNEKLDAELKDISTKITQLSETIVARKNALDNQARTIQRQPQNLTLLNSLLDSKSLSDAVRRVITINQVTEASTKQLKQDEANKKELEEKQKRTQVALETIIKNQELIQNREWSLKVKQAQLDVATLESLASIETDESKKSEYASKIEEAKTVVESAQNEQKEEEAAKQVAKQRLAEATGQSVSSISLSSQSTATGATQPQNQQAVQGTANVSYNYAGASTYPVGQCTWGAKVLAPWAGPYWGNGGQWVYSAAAAGFKTGYTPVPGAIICWTDGGYGHVAVVTAVRSATEIQVMESNYNYQQYIANFRGWFNPIGIQGQVSYIYPPGS